MQSKDERGKYPIGTVVRLKKTGQFAIITDKAYLKDGVAFLNYYCTIEDRGGPYALYDDDFDLECLPPTHVQE